MAGAGDYLLQHRKYQGCSTEVDFATTDGNLTLIAGKTNKTIRIQRVIVTFKTSAAQAILFEDSNSPKVYVAKIAASPPTDAPFEFDFGPLGKPLTSGKDFLMDMASGNAGHIEVLAYYKPDATMTVGNNN